ncbi:MAG: tetratricopeptide repeat protein [Deltaproteobacteria bacterium]|nr:tetratricopeptide repeat protein [Myxococcales bacterium]MDP3219870.1 tetratricopeptide repeat protein [Deltaproteobacteria bacterium]
MSDDATHRAPPARRWPIVVAVLLAAPSSVCLLACLGSLAAGAFPEAACRAFSSGHCVRIADSVAATNVPRAAVLYQIACDRGDAIACTTLGVRLSVGRGLPRERDRGLVLLERGCRARAWGACTQLGAAWWSGDGRPHDPARAVLLFRGACETGDLLACAWAGLATRSGVGTARDVAAGDRALMRVCDAGDDIACADAGRRLLDGDFGGITRDATFGEALLRRGCARGLHRTCAVLRRSRGARGAQP